MSTMKILTIGNDSYELVDAKARQDIDNLGALAQLDTASAYYTPLVTVSQQPSFSGSLMELSGTYTPEGTISLPVFRGTQSSISVSGTPSGSISVSIGSGIVNYTPEGTISAPTISANPSTATVQSVTSSGQLPSCTLPSLQMSVNNNETLTVSWSDGSFSAGSLPTTEEVSVVTSVGTITSTAPLFSGVGVDLEFTGTSGTYTGTYTPAGAIDSLTFTGREELLTLSGTPSGTISNVLLTCTGSTITVS